MRELDVSVITEKIAELCIKANNNLPQDIVNCIDKSISAETSDTAVSVLNDLKENICASRELKVPICQDTGMAVVFMEIGQDVHLTGGLLSDAVNLGVKKGYEEGLLRKSVVSDPLIRVNTGDNTPAVLHTEIVAGEKVKITVAPKGFGSENMSGVKMLTPAASREGVINAVLEIVTKAGSNPCPPITVGIGIGGDFEQCALLSKKALCRSGEVRNENAYYCDLEEELLEKINSLNIGPQGFGGKTTALYVNIETAPTHIAGLPVAVNIGCHVTRHEQAIL